MKVKIGQLKTHLSSYVKSLGEGGEPIEVCIREDTVAYLTASNAPRQTKDIQVLARDLEQSGLTVSQWGRRRRRSPSAGVGKDGRHDLNSVVEMRRERDW